MLPRRLVVVTTIIGLLVAILIGATLFRYDTNNVRLTFEQEINHKLAVFEKELQLNAESVHVLSSFFASSNHVSPSEFALFSQHLTSRSSAIRALEWAPLISHEQRLKMNFGDYNYTPNLQITQQQTQGVMKNAEPREYYFPVLYIEPLHGNEHALGFDLASTDNRKTALLKAINSGKPIATAPLQLVQADHLVMSVLLFQPVYKSETLKVLTNVEGLLIGVFSLERMFESAVPASLLLDVSFRLVDTTDSEQHIIYQSANAERAFNESHANDILFIKELAPFYGRTWRVYAQPSVDYIASHRSTLPYVITFVAIALIALIAYYTHALTLSNYQLHLTTTRLKELNRFDQLTGIHNRGHFDELIEAEWQRAKRANTSLSLLMIDIDFFKNYNDHYGHLAGDKCLVTVAHTLNVALKRSTDVATRYGGEEFAVVLPSTKDPIAIGEKLRKSVLALALEHKRSNVCDYVTISVGVATLSPTEHNNYTQLIMNADAALYQAKRDGRNRVRMFNDDAARKVVELKP